MKAKTPVLVILTIVFVLMLCGAASAGIPLQENQTGTVSGDLYVNTTDGWPSSTQGATNIVTQTNTLPTYTSIDSAWVYVNVYSGSGSNNWPVRTTVQLDGNGDGDYDDTGETLGVEDMNIPGSPDGTVYWLNDHCMRVYSDYQVWYNVTGLVTSNNPTLYVKTENMGGDGYDGRIKLLALTVAYNDGDTDHVDYWVLNGQDWINTGSSSSTFNTSSFNGQVSSATLNTVALSSADGTYTLNTSSLTGNLTETGSYYKEHQWDVTSNINSGADTNLTYTNVGASLKLNLATLTIREITTTPTPLADFTATPTTGTAPLTVNFTNTSTDATTYQWDFNNDGTTDSTDTNPSWTYNTAGTYTVKLTATGAGGSDEDIKTNYITVNPAVLAPVADFTGAPTSGTAPLTINFTDTSTNTPTSWVWYFGDENYTGSWTQMTASANWTARRVFASVVLPDSSIVMMGGYTTNYVNDVWRSTDEGATWTQMTANAGWSGRFGLSAVVLPDGSIVMMGGRSGSTYKNDVWRSTDEGATWTQMTANAGWSARYMSSSIVLPDGSIILMGGGNASSTFSDVWQSTDMGVTWTQVTANPGWSARRSPASLILPDGSIVLMGGTTYAAGPLNDVWRSTDKGATWTQMTVNAGWSARYLSSSVALPDGSIILTGGWNDSTTFSDVWKSTDKGATWILAISSPGWSTRQSLSSVILPNGSIILMGGSNSSDVNKNDVWRLQTAGSLAQNPSHTYTTPGTYSVSLNAWNDSGSNSTTKSDYIIITGAPVADFTATPTNGSAPLQVTFTNTSTDAASYAWDFDNNGTTDSTDTNPTYTYNTVGTYTVKLTVTGPGGSDDEIKTDYITVNTPTTPVADFTGTPTTGTAPLQVTFTNTSTDAASYAWDFDNNGTTDSTDTNPVWTYSSVGTYTVKLTATGPLGTDEEIKTDYITANNLNIDLTITGLVNCVPASAIFAYEPNTITVSNIKNQGTDTATNIVVKLYASDVDGGNTAVTETTIASLGPGATVSLTGATALTDPTIRTSEGTVTYTAKVDPDNLIVETNETNNNKNSTAKPLRYNGYKGKRYWDGGSDITTKSTYDLRGDIVYYTQPSSAYKGVGWTTRTETWTATDLPIPEGATVEKALLFFSYNWDQTAGGYPNLVTTFNGININLGTPYRDWSNFGTYSDYEYGLYPAVDVTSLFVKNGDNTLLTTPGTGNTNALYPSTLAVIYSDPTETRKVIYINEECDELGLSQSSYATTLEEATAYATFNNVDTTNVSSATLHSFAGSAGPGEGNLLWNGTTIVSLGWPQGNSSTASAQTANVTSYLTTNNEAGIQGTTSGGMDALQQILVVEYADAAPVADFTGTPTTGTAPLQVTFTNTSTGATSYAWDFDNNGTTDSTDTNPTWTYTTAGTYTVKLTATGPGGSDEETKTDYITVSGTPDLVTSDLQIPSNPVIATAYPVSATVTNGGNGDATSFTVKLYDNNTQVAKATLTSLASGASTPVSFDWTPTTTGEHVLAVIADANNEITESDETNNQVSTQITVNPSSQPDLTVTNLQLPSNPTIGITSQVMVTVINNGTVDAGVFVVKLYDNNTQYATINLTGLTSGTSANVTFDWLTYTTGAHNLSIITDANQQITEYNEYNNQISQQATVNPSTQPDLTVTNLQLPANPTVAINSQVTVTVTNNGTIDSGAFVVKLYDNNTQIAKINLTGLAAGASTDVTFDWLTYTTGAHNLSIIADANQQITEYNENNNQISQAVIVNPSTQPDLTVTDLQLPNNPVAGTTYQITATVTNLGTVDAGAFAVKLYDNNIQLGKINITSLAAGTSTQITFNWTPTTGTHNLAIKADANNQITEYNEANNQIAHQVTVS